MKYKVRDNYLKQGLAPLDQLRGELNCPNMQASCLLAFLALSSTCHGKSEIKKIVFGLFWAGSGYDSSQQIQLSVMVQLAPGKHRATRRGEGRDGWSRKLTQNGRLRKSYSLSYDLVQDTIMDSNMVMDQGNIADSDAGQSLNISLLFH